MGITIDDSISFLEDLNFTKDFLRSYNYNGFMYVVRNNIEGIVKDYRYRPRFFSDDIDINSEELSLIIELFSDELDLKLRESFGVKLLIFGRMNAYWGINFCDAEKLIHWNMEELEIISNKIKSRITLETCSINSEERLFDFLKSYGMILDYRSKILDLTKLKECLDFIDESISQKELELNEVLRRSIHE